MKRFLGSLLVLLALAAPASAQTQLVCNQGSAKVPCSQPIGQAYIPGSIPATKIGTGTVSDTVFGYLNGVTSSIQTQLNTITAALVALSNAAPADIGTASAGVAATSSRSDHVHAHGNQLGGALHANAVAAGAAGFLTGADKTKIDALPSGGSVTLVSYGQLTNWLAKYYAGPFGISEGAYIGAENGPIPWKAPCAGTLKNFRLQAVYVNGVTTNATAYRSAELSSPSYASTAAVIPVTSGVAFGVYAGSLAVAAGDLILFQLSQTWATPAMIITAQFIPTSN